jgi:hypothetical protein
MIVFCDDAVVNIGVEWNFNSFLGVQAEPLPSIYSGASKIARRITETSVFRGNVAIFPMFYITG